MTEIHSQFAGYFPQRNTKWMIRIELKPPSAPQGESQDYCCPHLPKFGVNKKLKYEGVLAVKEELVSSSLSIRISSASNGILFFSKLIKLPLKTSQFFHFYFFQMGSSTRTRQPRSEDESSEESSPQPDWVMLLPSSRPELF